MTTDIDDREPLPPTTYLSATRVGTLAGILLVAWAIAFWFFKSSLSPVVYWSVFLSVGFLIVAVPSWLVGQRARREYMKKHATLT